MISEKQLCEQFIAAHPSPDNLYFECYINPGTSRADIVYREHKIITIYEAKTSLSIKLLEQTVERLPYANFVYAVIPYHVRCNKFLLNVFQNYGIGVLKVVPEIFRHTTYSIEGAQQIFRLTQEVPPKFNRHPIKGLQINPENKKETPGLKHGGITPFKIMVKSISEKLNSRNKFRLSLEEAFKNQSYYSTPQSFKANVYQWCRNGVITEFFYEKGFIVKAGLKEPQVQDAQQLFAR